MEEILTMGASGGNQRFRNEAQVAQLIQTHFLPLAAQFGVPAIASWLARLPRDQVLPSRVDPWCLTPRPEPARSS